MGAQLWFHQAPWDPDAATSLQLLQARFLKENYDLAALLPQHLDWARESVAAAKDEGDPYGLVDLYQENIRLLEQLCNQPIPEAPEAQIEILRQIWADSGQGIGNVLDIIGVSAEREPLKAQQLNSQEIARLVGTSHPTLAEAQNSIDKINEELGRGECVCFPFYENGTAAGWFIVGNTID